MKIKRVEHIAIAVENFTEAMQLLENTLGLKLDYIEEMGDTKLAMYPVGDTCVELVHGLTPTSDAAQWIAQKGQGLYHFCLEVEDIDEALSELRQKGVKLLDEQPRPGHGGSRIAFLDPIVTGNILIELAELPTEPDA